MVVDKLIRLPMPWQIRNAIYQTTNLISFARFYKPKIDKEILLISNNIKKYGFAVIDNVPTINADILYDDIKKHFETEELIEDNEIDSNIGKLSGIKYAETEKLLDIQSVIEFCEHPYLLNIADEYLSCMCKISGVSSWETRFLQNGASNAQFFHRDIDALKWLKVFIYLSDVDDFNGPHVYVNKSHKINKLLPYRRIKDIEIAENGLKEISIKGKKGTIIIADSFGLHKGMAPKKGSRAILQVTYCRDKIFKAPYPKKTNLINTRWRFFK